MRLRNDSPSFHPVHPLIRAFGSRDLHHEKGRGQENYTLCRCETLTAPPQGWTLLGRMPIGEALPPLGAVGNAGEAMFHDLRRQPVLQQLKAEAAAMGSELVAYSLRHRYSDEGHRLGGS